MKLDRLLLVLVLALTVTTAMSFAAVGQSGNETDDEQTPTETASTPTPTDEPDTPSEAFTPSQTATASSTPTPTPTATETQQRDYNTPTPTPTESSGNDAITEDGEILDCTTIKEPGHYHLGSDIQGNPDEACLIVEADARIDGNGHTLQGPGSGDTVGIRADAPPEGSSGVRVFDITLTDWDKYAIDHVGQEFRIENAVVRGNGFGYHGGYVSSTEIRNVEFTENSMYGVFARPSYDFRAHDITASNNGGDGLAMWGGGNAVVTSSEFNNNAGNGLSAGDRVVVEFSNVEVNGNDGAGLIMHSSHRSVQVSMDDSSITNNDGDGINGISRRTRGKKRTLTLENVHIEGNDGKTITAYDPTEEELDYGTLVEATDVTLGGGLTVSFDQQYVTLGTKPVDGAATNALNITGNASASITTEFQVDADRGELWRRAGSDWESHGEYETSDGVFQETLGAGAWTANAVTQDSTSSTPSGTPEPESIDTPESTHEPRSEPTEPTSTELEVTNPGNTTTPSTKTHTVTSQSHTDEPASPTTVNQSNTDHADSDDSEDSTLADGSGFTGLIAIATLLGCTLLAKRRAT